MERADELRKAPSTPARQPSLLREIEGKVSTYFATLHQFDCNITALYLSFVFFFLSFFWLALVLSTIIPISLRLMRPTLRLSKYVHKQPKNFKDSRYPLTNILTETFGGYINEGSQRRIKPKKSFDRHPGKRVEVVSEQLCGKLFVYNRQRHRALALIESRRCTGIHGTQPGTI